MKDVHLMIRDPLSTLADYVAAGADMITVHQESCTHIHRVLQALGTMTHATDPARGGSQAISAGGAKGANSPTDVLATKLLGDSVMDESLAQSHDFNVGSSRLPDLTLSQEPGAVGFHFHPAIGRRKP